MLKRVKRFLAVFMAFLLTIGCALVTPINVYATGEVAESEDLENENIEETPTEAVVSLWFDASFEVGSKNFNSAIPLGSVQLDENGYATREAVTQFVSEMAATMIAATSITDYELYSDRECTTLYESQKPDESGMIDVYMLVLDREIQTEKPLKVYYDASGTVGGKEFNASIILGDVELNEDECATRETVDACVFNWLCQYLISDHMVTDYELYRDSECTYVFDMSAKFHDVEVYMVILDREEVSDVPEPTPMPNPEEPPVPVPEPDPTPEPDPAPVQTAPPAPKLPDYSEAQHWDNVDGTIENKITEIAQNPAKDKNINITTGTQAVVPSDVLHMIKNSSATLAVHTGQGLTFSVSGDAIKSAAEENLKELNLKVNVDAKVIPQDVLATKSQDVKKMQQIDFEHSGSLGFTLGMHLALGEENAGNWANLYHYEPASKELDYQGSFRITESGQALFGLNHFSTYLVTVSENRPNESVASQSISQTGSYTIAEGDTLSKIALRYATTVAELMSKNSNITDAGKIYAGDTIVIE